MQAAVLPDVHIAIVGAPDGKFTAKQLALIDVAEGEIVGAGDGVPGGIGEGEGHEN
ncbi:hypothetical protein D3C87_2052990 [compost metagenome]